MTGKNPGKHGLYDFIARCPDSYQTRPFNASHRDGESLWRILSRAGKRVCVVNVPMTYPPEPVNGCLISGMGTPATAEDFCYPTDLLPELRQVVPDYEVQRAGIFDPRGRELATLQAVREMTEMRRQAALYLLQRSEWDFFMVVFMATDLVQHYFWHYMDPGHTQYNAHATQELQTAIRDCYQQIDSILTDILAYMDDDTLVIVMSDHGLGIQEKHLHINTWLWQQGYLHFRRNPMTRVKEVLFRLGFTPSNTYEMLRALRQGATVAHAIRRDKTLVHEVLNRVFLSLRDVDWRHTRAYSIGNIGPIYINLQGREPQGIVPPGEEYERLLAELTDQLMNLCDSDTGEPIVGRIYRREEIFEGAHLHQAPDLIFLPHDLKYIGYGLLQFPTNKWLSPSDRCGGHRMDGILVMHGPGVRAGHKLVEARLIDLSPTVLAALDVPIPIDMDGLVLTDAFTRDFQAVMQVGYHTPQPELAPKAVDLSAQEQDEILERLRGLGYVE
jgi:predicted AlkP superfamily phosphohydrolase/phosphomutase